jgi:type IV pilus assembly protein PilC
VAVFAYKSIDPDGRSVSGKIEAANLLDLEQRLARIGLDLITAESANKPSGGLLRGKVSRQDLITFCFQMEQLVGAGVPLLEGLTELRDSTESARFREVMGTLIEAIEGGQSLSQALAGQPQVFSQIFVSLVGAGERTGQLVEVLRRLADTLKWQDELAAYAKKIVIYPAFVAGIVFMVILLLMMFLVPEMAKFLKSMNQQLPLQTRLLIATSNLTVKYWYLVVGLPIVAVMVFFAAIKASPAFAFAVDGLKLRLPLIGPILRKIILARFASTFALMYSSGITVLEAMQISESVVDNSTVADGISRAGQNIRDGQGIAAAFGAIGMFPPLVLRMLKIGETTGALDRSLLNVSYFYNREVREGIDKVQAMIGPALVLVLGTVLGWVLLSIFGPLYDTIGKIKL